MTYAVTLILSFLVIGAVVIILTRVRTPRYRVQRENVIRLLRMVLNGTASASDWHVFTGIPIRYDPELEHIRRRCVAIEDEEFIGRSGNRRPNGYLFTQRGREQLQSILRELEAQAKPVTHSHH